MFRCWYWYVCWRFIKMIDGNISVQVIFVTSSVLEFPRCFCWNSTCEYEHFCPWLRSIRRCIDWKNKKCCRKKLLFWKTRISNLQGMKTLNSNLYCNVTKLVKFVSLHDKNNLVILLSVCQTFVLKRKIFFRY